MLFVANLHPLFREKAIQYAKAMGYRVIGIDISEAQLQSALELGAEAAFNSMTNPNYDAEIKQLTKGGCHAAAVFSASNKAYEDAPRVLR